MAFGSLAKRDKIKEMAELEMFELGDSARICRFSSEIAVNCYFKSRNRYIRRSLLSSGCSPVSFDCDSYWSGSIRVNCVMSLMAYLMPLTAK